MKPISINPVIIFITPALLEYTMVLQIVEKRCKEKEVEEKAGMEKEV